MERCCRLEGLELFNNHMSTHPRLPGTSQALGAVPESPGLAEPVQPTMVRLSPVRTGSQKFCACLGSAEPPIRIPLCTTFACAHYQRVPASTNALGRASGLGSLQPHNALAQPRLEDMLCGRTPWFYQGWCCCVDALNPLQQGLEKEPTLECSCPPQPLGHPAPQKQT